jgi:hypothetical protein
MFAVLTAHHIYLYSSLAQTIAFANAWNDRHPNKTARVFTPQVRDDNFRLVDVVETAENDEDYRQKLLAIAERCRT